MAVEVKKPLAILEVDRHRLEFLFDGVFAIAMTLLVLELRVPELKEPRNSREHLAAVGHHGPDFFSYLLSFGVLGVLWHNHQAQFRFIHRVTRSLLALTIGLMATAAAFPFCAALVGRYPGNPGAIVIYSGCLFAHVLFACVVWQVAERQGALQPDMDPVRARHIRRRA